MKKKKKHSSKKYSGSRRKTKDKKKDSVKQDLQQDVKKDTKDTKKDVKKGAKKTNKKEAKKDTKKVSKKSADKKVAEETVVPVEHKEKETKTETLPLRSRRSKKSKLKSSRDDKKAYLILAFLGVLVILLFVAMLALAGRGKQAGHTGSLGNIFGSSSKVTKKEDKEKEEKVTPTNKSAEAKQAVMEADADTMYGNGLYYDYANMTLNQVVEAFMADQGILKYMASAGYLGQTGILPNSDRKQFNGRTNLDMQLTKKLAVRMNMSFIKNDFSDPNASYYGGSSDQIIRQLNIISPMIPVKDKDGKYGQTNDGNPIAWLDSGQTVDNCNQNFTGALSVDYDIIDGLKATVTGAYVNEDQRHTERVLSIPDDPASASRTTSLVERFVNWKRYNFDALLNYSKNFGQHGLKVMVGYHAEKYEVSKNQMQRNNFPSNSLNDMDAGGASTQTNDGLSRELAMLSYFGRINYDFAGKYLLEANFRADASSRFAPGHRWGYFPSFSGAWRISEEEFMESTHDWLSSLKIRASWGMLGNQDALNKSNPWENQYYPWMQTYNLDGNYPMGGNLTTGYYQKAYRIEDLSWEKSTTWGIGLDAIINHVTFTFDYYDRKTTDIIMEVPVPTEFGLDPYFDNVGSMRNRGVEVQLGYNNKWNDWSLNVMGNMAYNKNKIEDLGGVDRMTNPDDGDLWRFVGKPIDSYYVYKADGFFQSDAEAQQWMDTYKGKDGYPFGQDFQAGDLRYVDTNGDGKLDADDRVLSKTINPVVTFGLNLNVGYKAFDLTLNFTGAANVGRAFTKEAFGEFSGSAGHPSTAWLDSWTPENTNASMPRVAESRKSPSEASNVMSDFWVINTSYLRLKTLQLGYTLPKSVLNAIGLSNVRVYYSAENLFTIDSMPLNVDPETVSSRLSSYPLVMTNSFGVNVTF